MEVPETWDLSGQEGLILACCLHGGCRVDRKSWSLRGEQPGAHPLHVLVITHLHPKDVRGLVCGGSSLSDMQSCFYISVPMGGKLLPTCSLAQCSPASTAYGKPSAAPAFPFTPFLSGTVVIVSGPIFCAQHHRCSPPEPQQ